ncbi:ACT domain-containing protein [Flavobacterium sp. F-380]|uniref:ACT domain-containing protein n=1 Tax=Flavobacterium kayseriense TaxID=2764714 RepID=A0ABR7JAB3_9FLAO|nr:ACT domain-containing protein [Flavobacterium kayseriense]MBC5842435.1 ACT domain-containing protein [Flavobacterium kayseriense]MBC5848965.1 ACT domain-containing protein [Flavobacterium kayseriense]
MSGEKNLEILLKKMKPKLNAGEFVFCEVKNLEEISLKNILMSFREEESITIIIEKKIADDLDLRYSFVASWITLTIHSALEAVGLTAAFSKALSDKNISCNVVAAFYHDHIFVDTKDAAQAMEILHQFSA